jgi:hypothetical protein
MPSETQINSNFKNPPQTIFVSVLVLSAVLWFLYRGLFNFPVIFDETLGKLIFFALPVWIYIHVTRDKKILKGLVPTKLPAGLLRGLAFGGLFGFVAVVLAAFKHEGPVIEVPVFLADRFWYEWFLAILTAFWESLFFFGFVQTVLKNEFKELKVKQRLLLVSLIFLLFHLPNIVLRFSGVSISLQVLLLYLFALGQAIIFNQDENLYTLIMTHTIWGMVLLIHF